MAIKTKCAFSTDMLDNHIKGQRMRKNSGNIEEEIRTGFGSDHLSYVTHIPPLRW